MEGSSKGQDCLGATIAESIPVISRACLLIGNPYRLTVSLRLLLSQRPCGPIRWSRPSLIILCDVVLCLSIGALVQHSDTPMGACAVDVGPANPIRRQIGLARRHLLSLKESETAATHQWVAGIWLSRSCAITFSVLVLWCCLGMQMEKACNSPG